MKRTRKAAKIEPIRVIDGKTLLIFREALQVLKPPPDQTVSQWAAANRILTKKTSSTQGKWENDLTPYLVEIMDAFTDPEIRRIVFVSASQVGKSEFEYNCIGYVIDNDPGPMQLIMPTIEDVEKTSKERITPMIEACPSLRRKVAKSKSRDSQNTIREKSFIGGFLKMIGSNAPAALASTPTRYIIADEVDRWAKSAGKEGDPMGLLEARRLTDAERLPTLPYCRNTLSKARQRTAIPFMTVLRSTVTVKLSRIISRILTLICIRPDLRRLPVSKRRAG